MNCFVDNLTRYRRLAGLTRQELAENIGLSVQAITHYENGTREPKLEILIKIADILNVTLDNLVGHINERDFKHYVWLCDLAGYEVQVDDNEEYPVGVFKDKKCIAQFSKEIFMFAMHRLNTSVFRVSREMAGTLLKTIFPQLQIMEFVCNEKKLDFLEMAHIFDEIALGVNQKRDKGEINGVEHSTVLKQVQPITNEIMDKYMTNKKKADS